MATGRIPTLADWRTVLPDVNPEELEVMRRLGMIEPTDMFDPTDVLATLREGIRIGRQIAAVESTS